MSKKVVYAGLIAGTVCAAVFGAIMLQSHNRIFPHLEGNLARGLSGEETLARYDQEKTHYVALITDGDARNALAQLREYMQSDPFVAAYCHEMTHEIARSVVESGASFSDLMQNPDEVCSSGYIHGLMEGLFVRDSDVLATAGRLSTECAMLPSSSYARGQCFHGLGHGFMYFLENDLPRSIKLCESFAHENVEDCTSGAYMENFNTDQQRHPSAYLRSDDFFYPCTEQPEAHKPSCFLYAPLYYLNAHHNDFVSAVGWCSDAGDRYEKDCLFGIGYQLARRNSLDPTAVEDVCRATEGDACLYGWLQMYININTISSPSVVYETCDSLRLVSSRSRCKALAPSVQLTSSMI